LWFGDFAEFEAVVHRLATDDALHGTMRANGARYVEANFRWPGILERYCAFIEDFAQGNGVP
jgi:glycosyltransferase involved in cell wall biosynthesis